MHDRYEALAGASGQAFLSIQMDETSISLLSATRALSTVTAAAQK